MNKTTKKFFPILEIIRGFLAIIVIYGHSVRVAPFSKFGFLGSYSVIFFFCISGFLLSYLAEKEISSNHSFNSKKFYWRRLIRIWPSYFLYIMIVSFLLLLSHNFRAHLDELLLSLVFLGNLKNSLYPFFISQKCSDYFNILWSLGVEEQFYLFFPLLVPALFKLSRFNKTVITIIVIVACTVFRALIVYKGLYLKIDWPGILFPTTSYIDIIFLSVLIGTYREKLFLFFSKFFSINHLNKGATVLMIFWICLAFLMFNSPSSYELKYAVFFIFSGAIFIFCILIFSFYQSISTSQIKRFLIYNGKLSYGLYLFHMPILIILRDKAPTYVSGKFKTLYDHFILQNAVGLFILTLVFCWIFSYLVYEFYEVHFRKLSREKFTVEPTKKLY